MRPGAPSPIRRTVIKEEFEVLPLLVYQIDGDALQGNRLLDNIDDLYEHVVQVEDRADGS